MSAIAILQRRIGLSLFRRLGDPLFGRLGARTLPGIGGRSGGIPANPFLIDDTFTDPDLTLITSHVPDFDALGLGYSLRGSLTDPADYRIISNKFQINENSAVESFAMIDAGVSDYQARVTITLNGINPDIFVRVDGDAADAQNYWMVNCGIAANQLRLFRVINGVYSIRANIAQVYTQLDVIVLRVVCEGDVITVFDDTNVISITTTDSQFNGETEIGLGGNNQSGTTFDDFRVVEIGLPF